MSQESDYNLSQTCACCMMFKPSQDQECQWGGCYNVGLLRLFLIGPRYVTCKDTCRKFCAREKFVDVLQDDVAEKKCCASCAHHGRQGIYSVCTREPWLSVALPSLFPFVPHVVSRDGLCDYFCYRNINNSRGQHVR